jgi:hypothetical protein
MLVFYFNELQVSYSVHRQEDHPLSATDDYFFITDVTTTQTQKVCYIFKIKTSLSVLAKDFGFGIQTCLRISLAKQTVVFVLQEHESSRL